MAIFPGWGTLVGAIADIIDKFVPNRRERLRDQMQKLEGQLADALARNDAQAAAVIMKQLEELRQKASDLGK